MQQKYHRNYDNQKAHQSFVPNITIETDILKVLEKLSLNELSN